ncbi:MAG: polysaccharide deacetylase family protein [Clostridia bacterium]|nr:polysaccharide deacetylase family protein [Clostridia bacterium]
MTRKLKTVYICFPEGKHKVLTMSYDDGMIFDRRLVEIFNKNGIKGTFHLNSGLPGDNKIPLSEISELYAGHEVSAHTYTHPTIARCPNEQVVQQVLADREALEEACGYAVRGMSYPNGSVSPDIVSLLPYCGIEYSRTVKSTQGFGMPDNFLLWNPTCHHKHNIAELGKQFLALNKWQYLHMMYVWGHSYEFNNDNNWNIIEEFCEMMGGHDDIWYATNIEIVDYMNAAKNLKYTVSCDKVYNPSAITVWANIDGKIYRIGAGETVSID